jgi:hypothetical protein
MDPIPSNRKVSRITNATADHYRLFGWCQIPKRLNRASSEFNNKDRKNTQFVLFSAFRDLIIGRFLMASFWSHVAEAVSFLSLYAGFLGSRSVGR